MLETTAFEQRGTYAWGRGSQLTKVIVHNGRKRCVDLKGYEETDQAKSVRLSALPAFNSVRPCHRLN